MSQWYWDRLILLLLPKADDQIYWLRTTTRKGSPFDSLGYQPRACCLEVTHMMHAAKRNQRKSLNTQFYKSQELLEEPW